jgi:hypothetical protein
MRGLAAAVLLAAMLVSGCGPKIDNSSHVKAIARITATTPAWVHRGALGKRLWAIEREFYESRGHLPAWINGDRTTPHMLGLVKFIFPNHFSIYLHDTPSDRLFNRDARTFSHGCIRIENPVALAEYVLRDQPEWTAPRIAAAMHARRERAVTLTEKIPVHIGYWTAWVEPDGGVTFTGDPYGIDRVHARLRGYLGTS